MRSCQIFFREVHWSGDGNSFVVVKARWHGGLAPAAASRNLVALMRSVLAAVVVFLFPWVCVYGVDYTVLDDMVIQEGGRKKPFLVFAEEALLGLSGRTSLEVDGERRGAVGVVAGLWLDPGDWHTRPLVLVAHRPLKEEAGLDPSRKLFSHAELVANAGLRARLVEASALRARPGGGRLEGLPKEAADVGMRLAALERMADGSVFRLVPHPDDSEGQWAPVPDALLDPLRQAGADGDAAGFAAAADRLRAHLSGTSPSFQWPPAWRISLEILYQRSHPIRIAWILYLAAGLVVALAGKSRSGYAAAWVLACAGFLVQAAGFTARVLISGRAPVTNMYESVLWVAFGTVFFALLFEAVYRSRVFLLAAAPVAVVSLILADSQPAAMSRAITPLVPVLRDNFWLTTHVLTITLSYAAFALALALGHLSLGSVILRRPVSPALHQYLYRVLQAGVLLLATGTILGGVWANYSWGRFWDWDPKEVWALVTLLAYLFVLHGRVAGRWGGFGVSVGAVLCFLSVLMAWYGVNFVLGAGLHSYGFGSGGFGYAAAFVAAELVFVGLAVWSKGRQSPTVTGVPTFTRS